MFLTKWSQWLRQSKDSPESRRAKARPKSRRPHLEALEDRCMPTTFAVNSTLDTWAVDLATAKDSAGNITLRSAIMAVNHDFINAGDNRIVLPAGTFTLTLAGAGEDFAVTGDLDIFHANGKVTITGAGASATIIDIGGLDRVFHVRAGANLELSGVTVRGGDPGNADGGGILNAGGATLTVTNSTLSGNRANYGGGIANFGTATVSGSTLAGNSAFNGGGGILNDFNDTVMVSGSTLSGNSAGFGGGIYNVGTATVSGSTISGNSVPINQAGGGIRNSGTLTVSGSTLAGNSAGVGGGGIWNDGTATVSGSTISGNSAGKGGGIRSRGTLTLSSSTLSGNTAGVGGGIWNDGTATVSGSTIVDNKAFSGGGIDVFDQGTLTVRNTILAGNTATNGPNFQNSVVSTGNNLVDNTAGSSGWVGSDLLNVDARLGPLANNGGPTLTHALLAGSPAIDAGNNTGASALDQRGFNRFVDSPGGGTTANADIGAFEAQLWMADILDRATDEDTVPAINFATSLGIVNVTATSDNPVLVRAANLRVTGAGAARTLTMTPVANQHGTALVTVTVSDGTSTMTDTFVLTVNPVNDAPLLDDNGIVILQAIYEDDVANLGTRVSDLLLSVGGDRITDVDAGAVEGIAVIAVDNSDGDWQFSILGGATWTSFGTASATQARLLVAGAFVRFVPHANFNSELKDGIVFHAWDQTSGANGGAANTSTSGGSTPFSASAATAAITTLPVNDAPNAVDDGKTIDEDSGANAVNVLTNDSAAPDTGETLAIVSVTQGARGGVAITGGGAGVAYTPNPNFAGADSFTYTVADGNGGLDVATVTVTVNAVNDAPVNTVPLAQKTKVNTSLIFSGLRRISIADIDAGNGIVSVTLTVTNGTLTLGRTAGLASVTGNGKAKVSVTGTVAALNNALNNLRYKPKTGFRGKAKLTIFTEDLGNTGLGGPKNGANLVSISVV